MLSFKTALALGALGVGSMTFGTVVHMATGASTSAAPALERPVATHYSVVRLELPVLESPRIVDLDPVRIFGIARRRAPFRVEDSALQVQDVPVQETPLQACSPWRALAVGPVGRSVRDLCVPVLEGTTGASDPSIPDPSAQ
jgi:hypothetical protein